MNKKTYQEPTMDVVVLQHQHQLLDSSPLNSVNTTNLPLDEVLQFDDTPKSDWGR